MMTRQIVSVSMMKNLVTRNIHVSIFSFFLLVFCLPKLSSTTLLVKQSPILSIPSLLCLYRLLGIFWKQKKKKNSGMVL